MGTSPHSLPTARLGMGLGGRHALAAQEPSRPPGSVGPAGAVGLATSLGRRYGAHVGVFTLNDGRRSHDDDDDGPPQKCHHVARRGFKNRKGHRKLVLDRQPP